ncbi:VWA domain-containing protein [Nocardia mangyaensis]|uniref:VWA domain-containing protein n=1 Tax=Nocardia mangyaensis TaxID=2213200 RepID=UPI00267632BA|nr:VWA domain-containing protein [Nocardia mangyaensis]MDO3648624.1 VWA domain-containing protein [Nocardia mangyaensis]
MTAGLMKGQNAGLGVGEVVLSVRGGVGADLSALLVTEAGKVRSDADFVFFNQPHAPGVRLDGAELAISLGAVPGEIAQIRAVITAAAQGDTFGGHAAPVASVADRAGNVLHEYVIDGLDQESVVIALELYRRGEQWKVRAVGQGYAGGFADLVTDHGVSVDDEPEPVGGPEPVAVPQVRTVPGEAALSFEKRQKLDLRKREVAKILIDKSAFGVRARVVLVIDKTGSMHKLFRGGTVHRVVERMIPVATQLDDDGSLEAYLYALQFVKLPDITVAHGEQWAQTFLHLAGTHEGIDYDRIGGRNDELPVMRAVIDTLSTTAEPTLVLFFTDGGFAKKREIAALMREASALPAFWQFIGLGTSSFGVLRTLDELDGRVVDNAGFFALDDIDRIDDAELYRRLLGEFPDWLRAARAAGIVRA